MNENTMREAFEAQEPIISMFYDKDKEGNFYSCMIVSGFDTEDKAIASLNHIKKLFCAEEVGKVKS